MRIHWLAHVEFEGLGIIAEWADSNGHALTCTRLFEDEVLPPIDSFDFQIIMGGPMSTCEKKEYPFLK